MSGCTKVGTSKWEVGWPTDPIIVYLFLSEVSRRSLIQVLEREVWLSADHWKDRPLGKRRWSPGMPVRLRKLQLMKLHRQAPAPRKNAILLGFFKWKLYSKYLNKYSMKLKLKQDLYDNPEGISYFVGMLYLINICVQ
jgi:hypothetical protein